MLGALRIVAREAAVMVTEAGRPMARLAGQAMATAGRASSDTLRLTGTAIGRVGPQVPLVARGAAPIVQRGLAGAGVASHLVSSGTAVAGGLGDAAAVVAGQGRSPVLLIHGFAATDGCMANLARHLESQGRRVFSINLFPNLANAETQATKVAGEVERILQRTGAAKIDLVGHSFGGLISRQFAERMGGQRVVDNLVTIATPHFGTRLASLGVGGACQDMRVGSRFLTELNNVPRPASVTYSSIWSNADQIILPNNSAVLPGSRVYPAVANSAHVSILSDQATFGHVAHALGH